MLNQIKEITSEATVTALLGVHVPEVCRHLPAAVEYLGRYYAPIASVAKQIPYANPQAFAPLAVASSILADVVNRTFELSKTYRRAPEFIKFAVSQVASAGIITRGFTVAASKGIVAAALPASTIAPMLATSVIVSMIVKVIFSWAHSKVESYWKDRLYLDKEFYSIRFNRQEDKIAELLKTNTELTNEIKQLKENTNQGLA
jgi:hypothetical protein